MTPTDAPNGEIAPDRPSGLAQAFVVLLCLTGLLTPFLVSSPSKQGASVGNELVLDGRQLITQHEVLSAVPEHPGRLVETLTTTWWGSLFPEQKLYRPLSSFTLGLAGVVSGERYDSENPGSAALPYKLFAVALKVICSLLVLQLATTLLGSSRRGLIAGLLFATLPVHGEAVFDVAGIAELLCAALSLGSWYAWIAAGDRPLQRPVALAASLGLLFLAVHAKESAYGLPLVFLLTDAARSSEGGFGAGLRHALTKLPALAAAGAVLALAVALRLAVVGGLTPGEGAIDMVDNPLVEADPLTRAANAMRILASGVAVALGFNPLSSNHRFSADYSFAQVEALPPFAWQNLVGIVALVWLVGGAIVLFRRCRTRAALILAYFASLLIVSNLFFPIGTVFGERLLFFPSALLVMFIAPFLARFGTAGLGLAAVVAMANGYWTYARADVFKSDADLWDYTATESATDSARAAYNQGIAYAQDQLNTLAEQSFQRALEKAPEMNQARLQLAMVRLRNYDFERGLEPLRETLERIAADADWNPAALAGDDRSTVESLLYQVTNIDALDPGVDPERNLAFLNSLLERGLSLPEVHVFRAETLRALARLDEAEQALATARGIELTDLVVQVYSRFLERLGRSEEARALLEERLATLEATGAGAGGAMYRLRNGQLTFGEDPAAAFEIADALLTDGTKLTRRTQAEALILRGQARLATAPAGDALAEARAIRASAADLQGAIASMGANNEQTYVAITTLANLLMLEGRDDVAEAALKDAIGFLPGPTIQLRLGQVQLRNGRPDEALESLRSAANGLLNPDGQPLPSYIQARVEQIRALALGSEADADQRINGLLESERLRNDEAAAYVRAYGFAVLERWSDLDSALLELRAVGGPGGELVAQSLGRYRDVALALRQSPNDLRLLTERAQASENLFDSDKGLVAINRAIELTSTSDPSGLAFRLAVRARLLEQLGRLEDAAQDLERALAQPGLPAEARAVIDPNLERVRVLLGRD
jgi:tetratricopeptide (TPR) repeat protein